MTHDEIAEFVARTLKNRGYPMAVANVRSNAIWEQPDVIGFNSSGDSMLCEVKVSRSDFLADKKKPFRCDDPSIGYGRSRAYVTPKGLLNPDEVPYGWQLWEIHGKKKPILRTIKGHRRKQIKKEKGAWATYLDVYDHCTPEELNHFKTDGNLLNDLKLCLVLLKRMQKDGVDLNLYADAKVAYRREIAEDKRIKELVAKRKHPSRPTTTSGEIT